MREVGLIIADELLRSWRGQPLVNVPYGEFAQKYGRPKPLIAKRSELVRVLASSLPDGVVETGAECVAFEQDGDSVTVRLADGREERGSVLVGADGVDSGIRLRLFGPTEPFDAGYNWVRSQAPAVGGLDLPPDRFELLIGPGRRIGVGPPGEDWTDWWAAGRIPKVSGSAAFKESLLKLFDGFAEPVGAMIEATEPKSLSVVNVRYVKALDRWVDGRLVLVGDAAHAMTPDLGRGANEAIADGVALADCLAEAWPDRVQSSLVSFEQLRRPPLVKFQAHAKTLGRLFLWSNPAAWRMRDWVITHLTGPRFAKEIEREFAEGSERP
jgi:2-polyprenyl-6-methoxyphenol hydroxylase-like FAD-dependent oxidoreductase